MGSSLTTPKLQPDELTLHLIATGVVKLAEQIKDGKAPTLPYPREIQRGMDRVVLNCLRQRRAPPKSIPDLLSWCRRPLRELPLDLPEEDIGTLDLLLDGQIPTSICLEWACASPDIEAELTQKQLLLNVIQVCKSDQAPDSYTAFRRLLITKPVLSEFELLQHCAEPKLERLYKQIHAAYEEAPDSCAVDNYFYCCSNCGNIMLRTNSGTPICGEERCLSVGGSKPGRKMSKKERVKWLHRGLRRFIAAPGRAEIRLFDKLEKLELLVELWPNFDNYDLRIVFPNGEAWAIDVKDWANPFLLAQKVKQLNPPIPTTPPWTQAYFVFPDDRREQRPDYLRAFNNHCQLKDERIKAKFESDLIKDVRNYLGRCK